VERIALAKRDHALGERASCSGAQNRGLDAFLLDEVRHEITQNRATVSRLLSEFVS
jgi:hypothetical protein